MWTPSGLEYVRRLGQGGTARVHLLENPETRERVSLKLADSTADAGQRQAVAREVEILSDIAYPGLPCVLDSGTDQGRTWYTYRHVDGRALGVLDATDGRDAFDSVARGLLAALSVLHDLGWVHYDVSPDNVLVTDPADWTSLTLIDLGHVGRPGRTLLGTPGYMAPEILRGEPGGPKSDLFSAGITLIEYALGERLFAGRTQREMAESVTSALEWAHGRVATALGEERADLLIRMASPEPTDRPADAWEVLGSLGDVPAELVRATFEAVVASGLPEIGVGDQARADLATGLKGLAWEAGSANTVAERTFREIANPRFDLARFLSWLVTNGSVRRAAGAWLVEHLASDDLAHGFDADDAAAFLAGLSGPSREALLLLAAAAEYRDDAAGEWLAHRLIPELAGLRAARRQRLEAPAYSALLRAVAVPEELDSARLKAADMLTDERLRPARLFLRLRAGRTDNGPSAAMLVRIARQGRLREARQIADAIEARVVDGTPVASELLVAAAWARAELRDWAGCRRILDGVGEEDLAVRLLDARAGIQLDGSLRWSRGEIPLDQSGEATLARLSVELLANEDDGLEAVKQALLRLSPFILPGDDPDFADVLLTLAPLVATPSPVLAHCVLSITSTIGRRYFNEGDIESARRVFETGNRMAESAGLIARAARFEGNLANCLVRDGESEEAAAAMERLAHRREEIGDTVGAITVWGNLGVIHYNADEVDAALVSWERQAALIRETGDTRKLGVVTCRIGSALQEIGSWGSAREAFESSILQADQAGDHDTGLLARENLAALHLAEGDVAGAETAWRDLDRESTDRHQPDERVAMKEWIRTRIDLDFGRPVLTREETLGVLESPDEEFPERLASWEPADRMEIALRNAMLIDEGGDWREALPEDRTDQLDLVALLCALPGLSTDRDLLSVADRLPEGVVTSGMAQATATFCEILVWLEAERGRSPGLLAQQVHELAHRTGLPGLLWRSHLAIGLKDLRRGELVEAARSFGTSLRLFRECHAPGSPTLPASLRERPEFRALGNGIRSLSARVTGREAPADDQVSALQELLTSCALELSGHGEGGGKWERGIEKILSVSETLNSTTKLDPLLEQVVENVLDLCDAEYGFMVLTDEDGEPSIRVARGGFRGEGESAENQVSNTLIRRVLDRRRSILIENALDEKDLVDKPSVQMLSLQSIMCAPLIVKDRLLGAILVDNRTSAGCFTGDDLRLLEVFASQAAVAIQNTRLFEDLEESYRSLEDAQERLVRSEKLKSLGVLAGGIAHDFNNLLMSILGNADLALMYLDESSPAAGRVGEIKSAGRLAGDLCSQLLAYSGRGQVVVGPLDMSEAVRGVSEMLKVSLSKKVMLTSDLAKDLPGIEADATQIRQVIMNLMTNAAESCGDEEGLVSISTTYRRWSDAELSGPEFLEEIPAGEYVSLTVGDTGCGMDEEARSRLFEPFFTTKFTGRGLGLSAVLGIVRGHDGTIRVRSTPGQGTTMTALFPATTATVEPNKPERAAAEPWKGSGTVLLVDDEAMVREVAREMLRVIGLTVVTAVDGLDALAIFRDRADEFDLVVLDMNMPKMSGDEVFREMRNLRADARIVISSGYSEADTVQTFRDDPPAGFLEKPYAFAALREKLHSLLGANA